MKELWSAKIAIDRETPPEFLGMQHVPHRKGCRIIIHSAILELNSHKYLDNPKFQYHLIMETTTTDGQKQSNVLCILRPELHEHVLLNMIVEDYTDVKLFIQSNRLSIRKGTKWDLPDSLYVHLNGYYDKIMEDECIKNIKIHHVYTSQPEKLQQLLSTPNDKAIENGDKEQYTELSKQVTTAEESPEHMTSEEVTATTVESPEQRNTGLTTKEIEATTAETSNANSSSESSPEQMNNGMISKEINVEATNGPTPGTAEDMEATTKPIDDRPKPTPEVLPVLESSKQQPEMENEGNQETHDSIESYTSDATTMDNTTSTPVAKNGLHYPLYHIASFHESKHPITLRHQDSKEVIIIHNPEMDGVQAQL